GLMSSAEYQLYCSLWDFLVADYSVQPDLILYLRTPAAACLERIEARDRSEENGITLEYLLQLEGLHDEWLLDNPGALVIDGARRWNAAELQVEMETLGFRVPNRSS
ncbi:MAG: deoxynucleoside kinase, partial [Chloroflexota bacterium]|nr:deoxynucleoside kinase [Chloroflexota bacterium]